MMRDGVRELTEALFAAGDVHGAICMAGPGTHLSGPAFQALPIGFPKLVVSPLASGQRQFEPYVGLRDVAVMHSVADIAGSTTSPREVFRSAAGYIVGAASAYREQEAIPSELDGPTDRRDLDEREHDPGHGPRPGRLESGRLRGRHLPRQRRRRPGPGDFVESGRAAAVLDFTTTELGATLVGGLMDAGPNRMEAAGRAGLPQVLVPGCVDFITCGTFAERRGVPRPVDVPTQP